MKKTSKEEQPKFDPDLINGERLCLNVPEVAKIFGISRNSAYELVRQGIIPSIKLGKRIVIPRLKLEEVLKRGV
ncbi:excisionase [Dehalococcoides mccartyi]|jgi:excisionase family DNA binding protein|uniref:helix-turn-helix domain-containing protein n=1 Tax=Dehalococcoides TaxID=61434 RepID=UPI0002B773EF|nr:helix-turn-helix domain-containing protein [Dehalococcoides mccartyi]AGG07891.1 DNA binding protein, excisionase family [Dehalococcoides mccartyi BTF08]AQU05894.1 excisionase [Dehalococcoides mccartyi]AQU07339.1 excisionase [Dehalococcoides mccartyi]AQW62442.1 excisionase [Dehalococcoides mccartyi]AQX74640.1 excisionase [Dehalococcoides mccartyi]